MAGELTFFELGVEDAERGRTFYEGLFGWRFAPGPSGEGFMIETPNMRGGIHGGDAGGGELVPGVYRHRLSTGELSRADFPRIAQFQVVGLATFAPNGAYMVDADLPSDSGCGESEASPAPMVRACQLIRATPLSFTHVGG